MSLLAASFHAAGAGNVRKNLEIYVAPDTPWVTIILDQGTSAYPVEVGPVAEDIDYEGGWLHDESVQDWYDTNGHHILRMDWSGLDVLIGGGAANSNGSIDGNVTLRGSGILGTRLRDAYGPGRWPFTDLIFRNGEVDFTVSGCVGIGSPDLLVESPAVSKTHLVPHELFTVSATAKNVGIGTCKSVTMTYRYSTNQGISQSDYPFGPTDSVGALDSGESSAQSALVNAPETPGVYWVGACVEIVFDEVQSSNNCSPGFPIIVGPPCEEVTVENKDVATMTTFQSCQTLIAGPDLNVTTDLGASLYAGESVGLGNGVTVATDAKLTVGTCEHNICATGPFLSSTCMPCVTQICYVDPFCCGADLYPEPPSWDGVCVAHVFNYCGLACAAEFP